MQEPSHIFEEARDKSLRGTNAIRAIIIHATAGTNSLSWLQGNVKQTSIHVLIRRDGHSYRMVRDHEVANHAGYGTALIDGQIYGRIRNRPNLNQVTLGIELENTNTGRQAYPAAQLAACGAWIAYWRSKYGANLPVLFHREVDPKRKTDPVGLDHAMLAAYYATNTVVQEDTTWSGFAADKPVLLSGIIDVYQGPALSFPKAAVYTLATPTVFYFDGIKQGQTVNGSSAWGHLSNELGFVHFATEDIPHD